MIKVKHLDLKKTYTGGDSIRGKVIFDSRLYGPKKWRPEKFVIKLEGWISWTPKNKDSRRHIFPTYNHYRGRDNYTEMIYELKETICVKELFRKMTRVPDVSYFEFIMRFPGPDTSTRIPATMEVKNYLCEFKCRHTLTVTKFFHGSRVTPIHRSFDLKFQPRKTIEKVFAPPITYHKERFEGLTVSVELTVPAVFSTNCEHNKVLMRLLTPETTDLRISDYDCILGWCGIFRKGTRQLCDISAPLVHQYNNMGAKTATSAETALRLSDCGFPVCHSRSVSCGYFLRVRLGLWNHRTKRTQSVVFKIPVIVCPALNHYTSPDSIATEDVIDAMRMVSEETTPTVTSRPKDGMSILDDCLPSYPLL